MMSFLKQTAIVRIANVMRLPLLFLGLLLTALSSPLMAQAGTLAISPRNLPRMYVGEITLDRTEYALGETIRGSFPLSSYGANETGNLKCLVSLVRLDKGGHVARMVYDRMRFGPLDIKGPGTKAIQFQYPITFVPQDDNLGIHVRIVTEDGMPLAWAVARVKIAGGIAMMEPQEGFVEVNSKAKYRLQNGPTIRQPDTLSFNLSLKNPSAESVSLVPTVTLTDKAWMTVAGFTPIVEPPVSIAAGETAKVRLELPVGGLKPSTYLAVISFKDGKGVQRAPVFYARYIIGGDMAGVDRVLSDVQTPIEKEGPITISVGYTGKPLDINLGMKVGLKNYTPVIADIRVKLFDENKKPVGEAALKGQKFKMTGFIDLPMTVKPARALSARVTVSQGGTVLCAYEGKVIYDAGHVARPAVAPAKPNYILFSAIAAVVLLAIILFAAFDRGRRKL
jgi:hypothetical protein